MADMVEMADAESVAALAAESAGPADPYAPLRASAAARRQHTVERVQAGIALLEAAGRPVSTGTLREVTGLDPTAIRRNAEAYHLFRRHSTHLQAQQARKANNRRRLPGRKNAPATAEVPEVRNPLANYPKSRLMRMVAELRQRVAEREALWQVYQALLQEHMQCALTIARLEEDVRELARYRGMIHQLRGRLQEQEYADGTM